MAKSPGWAPRPAAEAEKGKDIDAGARSCKKPGGWEKAREGFGREGVCVESGQR